MFNNQWNVWRQWRKFQEDRHRIALNRSRRIVPDRMNPFTAMSDTEFVTRFRLRKESVNAIIQEIQVQLPDSADRRGCRVPPHLQVLLTMAAMASGSHQMEVADSYDVSQQLISIVLARVSRALAGLSREYVKFPSPNALTTVIEDFHGIAGMPGVIGCIDCTHIRIARPPREDSEVFRCRKGFFAINTQAVCGPDLSFYNIVVRWPGSVHDAQIFEDSRVCNDLRDGLLPGHLLGDSGYGCRSYLLTPLVAPNSVHEERYNASHARTRNTIERAFGVLKLRFSYLRNVIRTDLETTKAVIVAAVVLHNIAVQTRIDMSDEIRDVNVDLQDVQINGIAKIDDAEPADDEVLLGCLKRDRIIRTHF
ncbi:putative nuclease HARBI1 isoform X4 [Eriocheir sinensis]|uniref:putative nuclease HARBI1 isoform X4 n=1 Tax=Eriocheir sinensis TaxID=95602 RepID=UPI0021CA2E37|nr:putative nuclease HARBI1 isoform X4 [Eriocheir sinensis]XP_050716005.1 putative nuclease HARBI1 isoform X4 [Eriocheir sinensis]XP_050716006.1 putative nuclease HARBI1 isoform X4 [Eriocheir sinensis]XP_050716007.1 putative nuclease HARBI1 isoform X4 [Eriocheir sinensis]